MKWPTLYKLAMSTLSSPASESFCERGFSWGGFQMNCLRTLLGDDVLRAMLIAKVRSNWDTGVFGSIDKAVFVGGSEMGPCQAHPAGDGVPW